MTFLDQRDPGDEDDGERKRCGTDQAFGNWATTPDRGKAGHPQRYASVDVMCCGVPIALVESQ